MSVDITALFVCLDDFCKLYKELLKANMLPQEKTRNRQGTLSLSEMLLIEILFSISGYKNFKLYYLQSIYSGKHRDKFKQSLSYHRFVALKKQLFLPLMILLHTLTGDETGVYFADSTSINVCHNKRISRNRVFNNLAKRSKGTMGWFYGFKLHLLINHKAQIMAVQITPGNTDDRIPLNSMG